MRIGFDGRFIQDQYHGIGRYAFELLRQLVRLEQEHAYIVFWNPDLPNSRFDLRALLGHPRVEAIPLRLPLYWPMEQLVLPALARRYRLDLFHSPYVLPPLLMPCPLVLTVHDLIFERYPAYMPRRWARGYYQALMRLGLWRARGVVTVSEATRRDLLTYYHLPPDKVTVTPEAVDPSFRPESCQHIAAVRRVYGLPEDFILAVGVRRPHKNIGVVVRALALIRDQIPHALILVGEPDRRFPDELPALIRRAGLRERVVEVSGVAERDLPALYGAAAVYVCPSLIEGFGLPVLEALACGCPVVASDRSSLPEVAGGAAILVDPADDAALAAALLQILTAPDLRADLHARGLAQAACFSWEQTAQQTLDLYRGSVGAP